MITHPVLLLLFVIANVAITAGYVFLAATVVPRIPLTLLRTKIGGVGFFVLCGLTHLTMALLALFEKQMSIEHMSTSWHMLSIHIPQAVCVWMFVSGLYIEVGTWSIAGRRPTKDADPVE